MDQTSVEVDEIRALAHQFAAAVLRPNVERWERKADFGPEVLRQTAELGFFGMLVPEAHGGMQLDPASWAAVLEELAWGEAGVALALAFHGRLVRLLAGHGSPEACREWLERLGQGEAHGCLALAEAESGTWLEGGRSTATPANGDWLIRGCKRWVSHFRPGGAMLVLARAPAGPTLFMVPTDAPGVTAGARDATLGLRTLQICSVELSDVRVPDSARVGEAGAALVLLEREAGAEAQAAAAVAVGITRAALEHALAYADVREQFGRRLRTFQGMQFKLADMAVRTRAARALLADALAGGEESAARMAKLFAAEAAMYVTTQAVQVFGGYGYMRDYPVEKLMRDARALSLLGGADELHRVAIAEALYRT